MRGALLSGLGGAGGGGVGAVGAGRSAGGAAAAAVAQDSLGGGARAVSVASMTPSTPSSTAVVLVSGGLDSTTVLALAVDQGYRCHTLSFDYGQRHRVELQAAERISRQLGGESHRTARIDLGAVGGSALTDPTLAVPEQPTAGIPITYVPARNLLFLSYALGVAEVVGARTLFIGVNAVDYSGYPDCRPAFIEAFERCANLATRAGVEGEPFSIQAPLIDLTKAEIIRRGVALGVDYGETISCYQADSTGRGCGRCDSCRLRREGFAAAGFADPTRYYRTTGAAAS